MTIYYQFIGIVILVIIGVWLIYGRDVSRTLRLPFVSRRRHEKVIDTYEDTCKSLRKELNERSSLTIPMITMKGIGEVRLIGTPETLKMFQDYIEKKDIKWKKEL